MRLLFLASVLAMATIACRGTGPKHPSTAEVTSTEAAAVASTPTTAPVLTPTAAPLAPASTATFAVRGGTRDGAVDIDEFIPSDIRVRVGDTIEWTSSGSVGHTVSFADGVELKSLTDYTVPDPADPRQLLFNPEISLRFGGDTYEGAGTYVSSGFIGVFVESKYRLTFSKAGLYQYLCLNHPLTMRGSVNVLDASAAVESPASVASRGRTLLSDAVDDAEATLKLATDVAAARSRIATANPPALHVVTAGVPTLSGQVMAFVPPSLDLGVGDTVIFETDVPDLHNVVFRGARSEFPPAYDLYPDPAGRGITVALSGESATAVEPPPGGFDASTFLSSGTLGVVLGLPAPRFTWRLTFTRPGTYLYQCTIHAVSGMAGVIAVR